MGDKKDRERFTIKFNANDPAHKTVIDILEQQGPRQKAQFIANAVLHYIHCSEIPDSSTPYFHYPDKADIEAVVLEILNRKGFTNSELPQKQQLHLADTRETPEQSKNQQPDQPILDKDVIELIANTMSAFRSEF